MKGQTAVASALTLLINDPALRQKLGYTLLRKVEAGASAKVATQRWSALFDELLHQAQTPRRVPRSRRTGQPIHNDSQPLSATHPAKLLH